MQVQEITIDDLPNEILSMIFTLVGTSVCITARVCSLWRSLVTYNSRKLRFSAITNISLVDWARKTGLKGIPEFYTTLNPYHLGGKMKSSMECNIILCNSAARHGNLETLKYLRSLGCVCNDVTFKTAIRYGHLEIVEYLANYFNPSIQICEDTVMLGGNLKVVKFLLENSYRLGNSKSKTCKCAIRMGKLEILKYLLSHGYYLPGGMCNYAVKSEQLEILKYLRSLKQPFKTGCCLSAIQRGNYEILVYLRENKCPWDVKCTLEAVNRKNLKMLIYLHENGCPWSEQCTSKAVELGCIDILKYLHENGCPWNSEVCYRALYCKRFDILRYLYDQGFPWVLRNHYKVALEKNDMRMLHCFDSDGDPEGYEIYEYVNEGNIEGLEHFRESSRIWIKKFCKEAIVREDIRILKYLHNHNYNVPMELVAKIAVKHENLEAISYFQEKGHIWSCRDLYKAATRNNPDIVQTLLENQTWSSEEIDHAIAIAIEGDEETEVLEILLAYTQD